MHKIENFLTYGQWNLDRRQIEKLKKEEERKERVGRKTFPIWKIYDKSLCPDYTGDHRQPGGGVVDTSEKSRPRQLSGTKKVGQDNHLGQKSRQRQLYRTKSRPKQLSRTKKIGQDN